MSSLTRPPSRNGRPCVPFTSASAGSASSGPTRPSTSASRASGLDEGDDVTGRRGQAVPHGVAPAPVPVPGDVHLVDDPGRERQVVERSGRACAPPVTDDR